MSSLMIGGPLDGRKLNIMFPEECEQYCHFDETAKTYHMYLRHQVGPVTYVYTSRDLSDSEVEQRVQHLREDS